MLSDDLDNLIDRARLLGRAEARKETGCYTPDDSRFCAAMYESISKYRRAIEAAVLAEQITSENFAERISDKFSELIERLGNFPAEAKKLDPRMWDVINVYNPRNQQQPEAAVLAELAKQEPAAYTYELATEKVGDDYQGWFKHISEYKPNVPEGSIHNLIPLYLHPAPAPEGMVMRWIDPNDKTQKQYLPWIGEPVLFCHDGLTYYGQHTGVSFKTGNGVTARNFNAWECRWMYPPAAAEKGQSNAS